ncbi:MAG TPA: hypothetical protein DIW23_01035 [Anaerolineae bacterium]|nr:hypothetical protein [Anaerolineae bacterium]
MFNNSAQNPTIPSFLRLVTAIECSVVFVGAVLLFFLPSIARDWWAWEIPPYNSRFVGAIYIAAYIPLFILWSNKRWLPGLMILWQIFLFTTIVMFVMFLHINNFAWSRIATYLIFFPFYIFLPINSIIHLYKYRNITLPSSGQMPASWRAVLFGSAILLTGYGLGLLISPETLTSFYPWRVDSFHGRIYSSAFLTPALGCWWLAIRGETSAEVWVNGLNLFAGGFFTIIGVLWTSSAVPAELKVDFSSPATWGFFFMFAFSTLLGLALIARARSIAHK